MAAAPPLAALYGSASDRVVSPGAIAAQPAPAASPGYRGAIDTVADLGVQGAGATVGAVRTERLVWTFFVLSVVAWLLSMLWAQFVNDVFYVTFGLSPNDTRSSFVIALTATLFVFAIAYLVARYASGASA